MQHKYTMYNSRFPVKADSNKKAGLKYKNYKDRGEKCTFL